MPTLLRYPAMAVLLCLPGVAAALAQQAESEAVGAPRDISEAEPIPAGQIAERRLLTAALLRSAKAASDPGDEVPAIRHDLGARKNQIEELQIETLHRLKAGGPVSLLQEVEKEWSRVGEALGRWLRTLSSRAAEVESTLEKVRAEKALWTLTRDSPLSTELTPELRQLVGETLDSIAGAEHAVRSARDSILDLQAIVGYARAQTDEMLGELGEEIRKRRRVIMAPDSAPLWAVFRGPGVERGLSEQIAETWRGNRDSLRKYVSTQRARSLRYLAILSVLVGILILLRRKGRVWVLQDRSLQLVVDLLERPVAAGVIIVVLFEDLLDPHAPTAWSTLLGFLMLIAALRLIPRVLTTKGRSWAYILVALFLLQELAKLTPDGELLHRVVLLLLSLAGSAAAVWLVRTLGPARADIQADWLRAIRLVAGAAGLLLVAAAIANIAGSVGFAMTLASGTLRTVFAAIVLPIVVILMRALVRVVMLLPTVRRLGIVSQRGEITRQTLFRTITTLAVIVWVAVTLKAFLLLDPVLESLWKLIGTEIPLGKMKVTPADVLIFALVIWVSFKLARVLCFALEADILPHMRLPRGVPGAVTRLTRYAVIVLGVIVAFSAAGFSIDRIAIVFGALGVGIGFGLQNVVSNFVSGLILLFERPIQVGDRIQLATFEGVVMDIGMRASTVRSYSGADIVVPNANLISAEVVNWTLRDRTRRMEIRLGVAYGTEPARVITILLDVATKHPHVDENPKPEALFLDFGESSLDFQLRAWTAAGRYLAVSSELRVTLTEALKEAGIQIPFPQRDLHIRSAVDDVSLKARREETDLE